LPREKQRDFFPHHVITVNELPLVRERILRSARVSRAGKRRLAIANFFFALNTSASHLRNKSLFRRDAETNNARRACYPTEFAARRLALARVVQLQAYAIYGARNWNRPTRSREVAAADAALNSRLRMTSAEKNGAQHGGRSHPATHGVLRLVLELDGEIITKATPDIGFLHRGDEKIAENMQYNQFVPYTDRSITSRRFSITSPYALAVEKN